MYTWGASPKAPETSKVPSGYAAIHSRDIAVDLIALLVAMVVLVALGVAYAANNYSASKGGTIRVRKIPSSRKGSMGG